MKQAIRLLLAAAVLVTCAACAKDGGNDPALVAAEPTTFAAQQDSVMVALRLDGIYEDDLKAVGFDLNAAGQPSATLQGQSTVSVLLIFKDADGDVAQVSAPFHVTGQKTLSLMKPNQLTAIPATINAMPIYVRGIIGGTYSAATQRVTFALPTTTPATPAGGRVTLDVPYLSPWTELGSEVDGQYHAKSPLTFRPQGMLLRLRAQRGSAAPTIAAVPFNMLTIRSTGFATDGHYDVSTTGEPQWSFADGQTGAVMRRMQIRVPQLQLAPNTTTDYYVVWGMPTGAVATSTKTYIYPNPINFVTNTNLTFWPEREGFSSEARRTYSSGKTYQATAVLKPTTTNPLDLVAPRPMNAAGSDFMTLADWPVNATSGVGFFTHAEALTRFNKSLTVPSGGSARYHLPSVTETSGMMPASQKMNDMRITQRTETLQVGAAKAVFVSQYQGNGTNTIYALRFQKYRGTARPESDEPISSLDATRQMAYRYYCEGEGKPLIITARPLFESGDKRLADYLNASYFYDPNFWNSSDCVELKLYSYGLIQTGGTRSHIGENGNFINVQGTAVTFNRLEVNNNLAPQGHKVNVLLFRDSD